MYHRPNARALAKPKAWAPMAPSVLNLGIFVFGKNVAGHELVSVRIGTLGNDAVGAARVDAGECSKVGLWSPVQVDRSLAAQPFFDSFGHRLGVPFDRSGFFRSFLPQLIGALICTC